MVDTAYGASLVRGSRGVPQKLRRLAIAGLLGAGSIAGVSGAQAANTGITAVVVQQSGVAFGGCSIGNIGTFTYYQGYATDSVDPTNPLNTGITDIALAPKDANGNVSVYFNFQIILPTNQANFNGRLIADWPNRSGAEIGSAGEQSTSPTAVSNCSGTFFYPQGYATAEAGWEQDGAGDPTNGFSPNSFNSKFGVTGVNSTSATGSNVPKMPIATNNGATITGPGYEYIVTSAGTFNLGGGIAFPNYPATPVGGPASACNGNGVLTHRKHLDDTPAVLPSSAWQYNLGADGNCDSISLTTAAGAGNFATCTVNATTCPTGAAFVNNDIYELAYTAAQPTVNGIGHAVNRDWYSWLKGNSGSAPQSKNPFSSSGASIIKKIYMTSVSQPDRTFNDYVQLGFNGDLNGKIVDEGAVNWVGAGAGISMNYRWSHTTETQRNRQQHLWVETFFPMSDATTTDPISGTTDGRNLKCSQNNTCPLNMNVWSGNEYWVKGASLTHTDPTGSFDLPDSTHPFARYYYMNGYQHGGGTQNTKTSAGSCQNYQDPLDAEYTLRAMFRAVDQSIVGNIPPPPSAVPTLAGGSLVSPLALNFPSGYMHTVNGVNGGSPFPVLYTGLETTIYRFNFGPNFYSPTTNGVGAPGKPYMIPTVNPPVNMDNQQVSFSPPFENNRQLGQIYPTFVPNVNADGNETAGVMMPEIQAPLGTYAGWNYRSGGTNAPTPDNDGPDGCESSGLFIPFYPTLAARQAASDPRPSVAERYPNYASYLNKVVQATDKLIWNRFLLCGKDTSPTNTVTSGTLGSSVIANLVQDWSAAPPLGAGQSTGGLSPPSFLPACNNAMTHNFNGGNGGIASIGGASGGNASSVLWRDSGGNVGVWLMNGTSIAQTSVLGNMPTTWSIVGVRDINGDGNADIIWRDTSGNVGIWLMNGTQVQSSTMLGNVPSTWSVAGTMGFNTGGYGSIVWRDNQGNVGLWFMNGATIVSTAVVGNMPSSYAIAGSDLQGDIIWRSTTTGDVQMWVMNGTQIINQVDIGVVPLNWTLAGLGDFNGDGSTDVLWRDSAGNVGIWLMNGTSIASTKVLGNVPFSWTIVQTGDYNGDGKSDILWIDNSGNVAAWFMNGTTITSTPIYGNIGATTWTVQAMNSE